MSAVRVPAPMRAIVLVEHDGQYILAAVMPDQLDLSMEAVDVSVAGDLGPEYIPGRRFITLHGELMQALCIWNTKQEALEALTVYGKPVRALLTEKQGGGRCAHCEVCGAELPNVASGECPNGCHTGLLP